MLPFIKVTIFVLVLLLCFVFYSISFLINSPKLSLHLSFHFVFDCSAVAFSSIIIYSLFSTFLSSFIGVFFPQFSSLLLFRVSRFQTFISSYRPFSSFSFSYYSSLRFVPHFSYFSASFSLPEVLFHLYLSFSFALELNFFPFCLYLPFPFLHLYF